MLARTEETQPLAQSLAIQQLIEGYDAFTEDFLRTVNDIAKPLRDLARFKSRKDKIIADYQSTVNSNNAAETLFRAYLSKVTHQLQQLNDGQFKQYALDLVNELQQFNNQSVQDYQHLTVMLQNITTIINVFVTPNQYDPEIFAMFSHRINNFENFIKTRGRAVNANASVNNNRNEFISLGITFLVVAAIFVVSTLLITLLTGAIPMIPAICALASGLLSGMAFLTAALSPKPQPPAEAPPTPLATKFGLFNNCLKEETKRRLEAAETREKEALVPPQGVRV